MRKIIYLLFALSLLLASCKSKKTLVIAPKPEFPVVVSTGDTLRTAVIPGVSGSVDRTAIITESSLNLPSSYAGIDRIKRYDFSHPDVPEAFEGFRIAFISDLHYKSLFREKALEALVRLLNEQQADVLLMGGDYQEGCQYVPELFEALAQVKTSFGTYGVMGNNDYERCYDNIVREMQYYGMHVLEHKVDTLKRGDERILIAGVRNPFDLMGSRTSPTLGLSPDDFVIMLVHTPDYVQMFPVDHTDLALAGHTHGGQVVVLGIAPIVPSRYGTRFLTGLKYTTSHLPVIITNGLGTSNKDIRIGAPSEIIMITLHRLEK